MGSGGAGERTPAISLTGRWADVRSGGRARDVPRPSLLRCSPGSSRCLRCWAVTGRRRSPPTSGSCPLRIPPPLRSLHLQIRHRRRIRPALGSSSGISGRTHQRAGRGTGRSIGACTQTPCDHLRDRDTRTGRTVHPHCRLRFRRSTPTYPRPRRRSSSSSASPVGQPVSVESRPSIRRPGGCRSSRRR